MDSVSISRYFFGFCFLILRFKTLNADSYLAFDINHFGNGSNFESQFNLYGDAQLVSTDNMSLQISGSVVSSAGRVLYVKPINLSEGNPGKSVSFATEFVFSLSGEKGNGLAFVMIPNGYPRAAVFPNGGSFGLLPGRKFKFIAVEFDTLRNRECRDINDNHVGIDIGGFVSSKVSNVSLLNLSLNSGEKLHGWVDYEASSKRLEVRLSKLGEIKPLDPVLSYPIDLSRIWGSKPVFVGLSSSSGNSLQKCNVYSWSLQLRTVPHWMHSEPLDPSAFMKKSYEETRNGQKGECAMKILAALIFGTGCGALGAIIVLFVWTVLGSKSLVVAANYSAQTKEEIEYKKPKVVDKSIQETT